MHAALAGLCALVAVGARWSFEEAYHAVDDGQWYIGHDNETATLAWGESYVVQGLAAMFRATGHPMYLDRMARHLDSILVQRDDARGVTDYRGVSAACWRNLSYQDEPYCYVVHSGILAEGLAAFAVMVRDAGLEAELAADGESFGDKATAYLVAAEGAALQTAEVREHVRRRLPEFMVPSVFLTLKALPLTPNAKVDRRALPEPDAVEVERELPFVAPASELERTIAGIWQELLNVKSVGMRDNFFDLGGHSLLAVQLHGRLRRELGRDLPLTDLFRFPTVQSLAAHLGGTGPATSVVEAGADRADARRQSMQRRMQRRN